MALTTTPVGTRVLAALAAGGLVLSCAREEQGPAARAATPPAEATTAAPEALRAAPPAVAAPLQRPYRKDYSFTEDWFTGNIPTWERVLAPYKGQPGVRYLEIGLYEGRSAMWIIENILTDPSARLVGIDIFAGELKARYLGNLELSGAAGKATTIVGPSQIEVRKLQLESFDIVYVDGSHAADDVLADAVQAWAVLKPGGTLIFDDYLWTGYHSQMPPEMLPRLAIDIFIESFRHSAQVVERGYQMIVKKTANPCATKNIPGIAKDFCTPVGPYLYDWGSRSLRRGDGTRVTLTPEEVALIEAYQRGRSFEVRDATPAMAQQPQVKALLERLGLH
jgi:predicted O-methyltransferase YrrM